MTHALCCLDSNNRVLGRVELCRPVQTPADLCGHLRTRASSQVESSRVDCADPCRPLLTCAHLVHRVHSVNLVQSVHWVHSVHQVHSVHRVNFVHRLHSVHLDFVHLVHLVHRVHSVKCKGSVRVCKGCGPVWTRADPGELGAPGALSVMGALCALGALGAPSTE